MPEKPINPNLDENVPLPDPTVLTTKALLREIELAHRLVDTQLDCIRKEVNSLRSEVEKVPQQIDLRVNKLEAFHGEKFSSVERQFVERDKRTEQLSLADKTGVTTALAAQEKQAIAQQDSNNAATNKMEANFTKLIEQTQNLLAVTKTNTDVTINDLKSKLDRGEGRSGVTDPATAETLRLLNIAVTNLGSTRDAHSGFSKGGDAAWGIIAAIAAFVIAAVGMAISIVKS